MEEQLANSLRVCHTQETSGWLDHDSMCDQYVGVDHRVVPVCHLLQAGAQLQSLGRNGADGWRCHRGRSVAVGSSSWRWNWPRWNGPAPAHLALFNISALRCHSELDGVGCVALAHSSTCITCGHGGATLHGISLRVSAFRFAGFELLVFCLPVAMIRTALWYQMDCQLQRWNHVKPAWD